MRYLYKTINIIDNRKFTLVGNCGQIYKMQSNSYRKRISQRAWLKLLIPFWFTKIKYNWKGGTMVQWAMLLTETISPGLSWAQVKCGISLYVLPMSSWGSSRISIILPPPKNMAVRWLVSSVRVYIVYIVPCDGLASLSRVYSHLRCIPSFPPLLKMPASIVHLVTHLFASDTLKIYFKQEGSYQRKTILFYLTLL